MLNTIIDVLRQGWGAMLLQGTAMTLCISIFGMALGVVIGIAGATIRVSRRKVAGLLVKGYTTVVRSVPELLIIYLLYFGSVQTAADIADAFDMGGLMTGWFPALIGILAIGLIAGSYSVEVFRGALCAIDPGQIEAARAIGMPARKRLFRIVLPQMCWYALPGANNVWQAALKDTALISLVGLVEIMRAAVLGAAATRESLALYIMAAGLYIVIGIGSQALFVLAERRYGRGMGGAHA
jgi:octopine/nopaline transport system permease protein